MGMGSLTEQMTADNSLVKLKRQGYDDHINDEIIDSGEFRDGVIQQRITHFYHYHNSHVKGHGWTFYKGTKDADFYGYIVQNELPSSWSAFGCDKDDFERIMKSFDNNPFMFNKA